MAKHFRNILLIMILALTMVFVSACSFFDSEDAYMISRIYSVRAEDESGTYIVVEYTGDERETDRFFIPDPERGPKGNGILDIESEPSADGTSTKLTIYYEDASKAPDELILPTGTFIKRVDSDYDEDSGTTTLTIYFSDPNVEPIVVELESGRDGKDGDRIKRFYVDPEPDEEGNIIVHVEYRHYNDDLQIFEDLDESFKIPSGKQGNGIESVEVNWKTYEQNDGNVYLDFKFENTEEPQTVAFRMASRWTTGVGTPGTGFGNVGDFYFDTQGAVIYYKDSDSHWQELVNFGAYVPKKHTVTFYTDATSNYSDRVEIVHGESFLSSNKELPTPKKEGCEFVGWFTGKYIDPDDKDAEINPNNGQFTDLTAVTCDIKLYARYRKVSE